MTDPFLCSQTLGTYYYDGDGRRVKKVSDSESTAFVYDAFGNLIAEYSLDGPPTNPDPQTRYLTTDTLGSTRIVTNQNGEVVSRSDFHPFGEGIAANESNRKAALGYGESDVRRGFTGYEKDLESELEFAQNRYYANAHGRFTSVDPLMASGKVRDPQSWNRYVYVKNNPLNLTDPSGLCPPEDDTPCDEDGNPIIEETFVEVHIDDEEIYIGIGPFEYSHRFPPKTKRSWWDKLKNWFGFDSTPTSPSIPTIPSPGPAPGPVEPRAPDGQTPDAPDTSNPDAGGDAGSGAAEWLLTAVAIYEAQKVIDELLHGKQLEDGYVYRFNGPNPGNLAPRLTDLNGLSGTTKEPSRSQEYIKLDVAKLRAGGLMVVNDGGNHVSIAPRNAKDLRQWQYDKAIGAAASNKYTKAVKSSIVEYNRGR